MRKGLIVSIAVIFLLGFAATAAAGPFADVPAKHWAYDSLSQLAKAGIIDGYGDGTFRGDKPMTRYEMAQIVARALEKSDKADAKSKAEMDKLSKEFANELNSLGVRMTKLENKVDSFVWGGDARIRYATYDKGFHYFQENLRLTFNAKVNEDTTLIGRFINMKHEIMGSTTTANGTNADGNIVAEAGFKVNKFLGQDDFTLTAGRFAQSMGATGWMTYLGVDGAKLSFGNKLKVEAGFANFKNPITAFIGTPQANQLYFAEAAFASLKYAASPNTTLYGTYLKSSTTTSYTGTLPANSWLEAKIWGLGFTQQMGPDLMLKADYFKNQAYSDQNTAMYAKLCYKGANILRPHTWGVNYGYHKAYAKASIGWGDFNLSDLGTTNDIQNYLLMGEYTAAKNILLRVTQSFNSKNPETGAPFANGEWFRFDVNFFF